jgi:hypothetical protein
MSDCALCTSATSCTKCSNLYLANDDYSVNAPTFTGTKCIDCPPASQLAIAKTYDGIKVCERCSTVMGDTNCVTCRAGTPNECLSCSKGFYLKSGDFLVCYRCSAITNTGGAQATDCVERSGGAIEILECSISYAIKGGRAPGNSCERCQAPINHRFDLKGTGTYGIHFFENLSFLES